LLGADPLVKVKAENGDEVQSNLAGAYNFENIATALCIGKFFGVEPVKANEAIAEYKPGNMRSQIVLKGSNVIVLDAYNANPSSMQAAIENLATMKADKKVAIIGDMFELEEEAEREHTAIGTLLAEKKFDEVYLCGSLMRAAASQLPDAFYFEKKDELLKQLQTKPITGATVLIKASRGIGLETVLDFM
jgi:UDP-N-acetylmuramoyl-tripeptide--D-alanyl-D-alanine ligase